MLPGVDTHLKDFILKKVKSQGIKIHYTDDIKLTKDEQLDINGEIIVVSQFTLHAKTKKGNRPSYIKAAHPNVAIPLYEQFCEVLGEHLGKAVQKGVFGAHMDVELIKMP